MTTTIIHYEELYELVEVAKQSGITTKEFKAWLEAKRIEKELAR